MGFPIVYWNVISVYSCCKGDCFGHPFYTSCIHKYIWSYHIISLSLPLGLILGPRGPSWVFMRWSNDKLPDRDPHSNWDPLGIYKCSWREPVLKPSLFTSFPVFRQDSMYITWKGPWCLPLVGHSPKYGDGLVWESAFKMPLHFRFRNIYSYVSQIYTTSSGR